MSMKRTKYDTFDFSDFDHRDLKRIRKELRSREIELFKQNLIRENIGETTTETFKRDDDPNQTYTLEYVKITYEPIPLPKEMIDFFGPCVDVYADFEVGYFKVHYELSKAPKYIDNPYGFGKEKNLRTDGSLHINIEGNTRDGTAYGPSFGPEYADKIEITFRLLGRNRYYEILTLSKLDKSVLYQDRIELRETPRVCLSRQEERETGEVGKWNVIFADHPETAKARECFDQKVINFWTNYLDNVFF